MQNVSMQRGEKVELNERQHKTLIKRKLISRLNLDVRGEEKLMLLDEISLKALRAWAGKHFRAGFRLPGINVMQIAHDRLKCPFNFAIKCQLIHVKLSRKQQTWRGALGNNDILLQSETAACFLTLYPST